MAVSKEYGQECGVARKADRWVSRSELDSIDLTSF